MGCAPSLSRKNNKIGCIEANEVNKNIAVVNPTLVVPSIPNVNLKPPNALLPKSSRGKTSKYLIKSIAMKY